MDVLVIDNRMNVVKYLSNALIGWSSVGWWWRMMKDDKQTDICDCRVAFATEKLVQSVCEHSQSE